MKSPKGVVAVEAFQSRLRLRWRHDGKRYTLSIGLPDSKVNRQVATQKAMQIELDMASGNFDSTLSKYKPQVHTQLHTHKMTAQSLFSNYIEYKANTVLPKTLDNYRVVPRYLHLFFGQKAAESITSEEVVKFVEWFGREATLIPRVQREKVAMIRSAWEWAIKNRLIEITLNPWEDAPLRLKVPPKQPTKPFTQEEIEKIIQGFRTDRFYSFYTDFVTFLFLSGCRTGEAIGLRWGSVSEDCSTIWIGESMVRGERKSTKTNRARVIAASKNLQQMLKQRRTSSVEPDQLVFPSPTGKSIDDHCFSQRSWRSVLGKLNIGNLEKYNTLL
ncbi:MAG: DUF3596 domain-containing protein [Cyanobacteriota bacterium]|nr:DUF3596 domain-containing protein [Cyanobacteriota bacterium]